MDSSAATRARSTLVRRLLRRNELYLFLFFVGFCVLVQSFSSTFLTLENLFDVTKTSAGFAILAMGVLVVLLSGGIDVSFLAIAISAQYGAVKLLIALGINSLTMAFLVSCAIGLALGVVNGLLISAFRLPTLITTLGTQTVFHGLLLTVLGSRAINSSDLPRCFLEFSRASVFTIAKPDGPPLGLSVFVPITVGVYAVTWLLLRYTKVGRGTLAIGGNIESARRMGFNVPLIQICIYGYVGLLAGVMGVINVALIRYVTPTTLVGSELDVIAAVVLGGARITGGKGTILGTVLGVAIFEVLQTSLVLLGLSSFWQRAFVGLIIIVGMSVTAYQTKVRNARNLVFRLE